MDRSQWINLWPIRSSRRIFGPAAAVMLIVTLLEVTAASLSRAQPATQPTTSQKTCGYADRQVTFEYRAILGPNQQDVYENRFCGEVAIVESWFADPAQNWWALYDQPKRFGAVLETYNGPQALYPDLLVITSKEYDTSEALEPAHQGKRGEMHMPWYRANENTAAIAHELTHVFFPNGNRMLAEGLAVYVQKKQGSNGAFPTFSKSINELLLSQFQCGKAPPLSKVSLAAFDKLTPPQGLKFGLLPLNLENDAAYAVAASFVDFLIETRGINKFYELYARTPLMPTYNNAGSEDRWTQIYGVPLAALDTEWKTKITTIPCP